MRQSLTNEQLLWLHYVSSGRVCHLAISHGDNGLFFHGSKHASSTLTQLISEYIADSNNDIGLHISLGWIPFQTAEATPIDTYDHLTAPWYFENMTRDQANAQLDYHPSGTFVCFLYFSLLSFVHSLCEVASVRRAHTHWIMFTRVSSITNSSSTHWRAIDSRAQK